MHMVAKVIDVAPADSPTGLASGTVVLIMCQRVNGLLLCLLALYNLLTTTLLLGLRQPSLTLG
jgi:hypothetical protein